MADQCLSEPGVLQHLSKQLPVSSLSRCFTSRLMIDRAVTATLDSAELTALRMKK